MKMRKTMMIAFGLGLAAAAGTAAYAMQAASAEQLRASGQAGEQADGYMGVVGAGTPDVRSQVNAINIQRRASYTQLASSRGSTLEEAAASAACEILAHRVQSGQYYRLPDGVWRKRNGNEPVPLPAFCG
jgi:uncharacterized protein YdbL (DUF1318 family)